MELKNNKLTAIYSTEPNFEWPFYSEDNWYTVYVGAVFGHATARDMENLRRVKRYMGNGCITVLPLAPNGKMQGQAEWVHKDFIAVSYIDGAEALESVLSQLKRFGVTSVAIAATQTMEEYDFRLAQWRARSLTDYVVKLPPFMTDGWSWKFWPDNRVTA